MASTGLLKADGTVGVGRAVDDIPPPCRVPRSVAERDSTLGPSIFRSALANHAWNGMSRSPRDFDTFTPGN
jgi:hypothetical protein